MTSTPKSGTEDHEDLIIASSMQSWTKTKGQHKQARTAHMLEPLQDERNRWTAEQVSRTSYVSLIHRADPTVLTKHFKKTWNRLLKSVWKKLLWTVLQFSGYRWDKAKVSQVKCFLDNLVLLFYIGKWAIYKHLKTFLMPQWCANCCSLSYAKVYTCFSNFMQFYSLYSW